MLQERCILFIGPVEQEGDGLLKGEFIESIRPFPQWYKTIYYCHNFEIYHCNTGKSLSEEELIAWTTDHEMLSSEDSVVKEPSTKRNGSESVWSMGPEHYRLGHYEITVDSRNSISWKKLTNQNTLKVGSCFSGRYFIPQQ